MTNYDGNIWGHNSPAMFSKIYQNNCVVEKNIIRVPIKCPALNLTIFPKHKAYAIHFSKARYLFLPENAGKALRKIKSSFFVHTINSVSKDYKLNKNSTAAYIKLAEKFCPKVLEVSDDEF
jgi:Alpha 1,4-glycosyltransferase conserved region